MLEWEDRGLGASRFKMSVTTSYQTRIHVNPSVNTIDSSSGLEKYCCTGLEKQTPMVDGE
jgi:hypothetical protein